MKIREASINDAEEIAAVHVESWKTTYTGIIPESYLAALSVQSRAKNWVQVFENQRADEIVYIAEDLKGKMVGFAHGGHNRNEEYQYGENCMHCMCYRNISNWVLASCSLTR